VNDLYRQYGKRAMDAALTLLSLPVTAPLLAVGWLVARRSTNGPGFFTQPRVGRDGRIFTIWKLRTMRPPSAAEAQSHTVGVTTAANTRITAAGAFLRRTKLDELPQLINVLRGEMSMVGPRPDVPEWLDLMRQYPDALRVRPGLTSLASLAYVDEEDFLAREADPLAAYGERVLPHKLRLNELYARNLSLPLDLRILALTLLSVASRRHARQAAAGIITALGGDPDPAAPPAEPPAATSPHGRTDLGQ